MECAEEQIRAVFLEVIASLENRLAGLNGAPWPKDTWNWYGRPFRLAGGRALLLRQKAAKEKATCGVPARLEGPGASWNRFAVMPRHSSGPCEAPSDAGWGGQGRALSGGAAPVVQPRPSRVTQGTWRSPAPTERLVLWLLGHQKSTPAGQRRNPRVATFRGPCRPARNPPYRGSPPNTTEHLAHGVGCARPELPSSRRWTSGRRLRIAAGRCPVPGRGPDRSAASRAAADGSDRPGRWHRGRLRRRPAGGGPRQPDRPFPPNAAGECRRRSASTPPSPTTGRPGRICRSDSGWTPTRMGTQHLGVVGAVAPAVVALLAIERVAGDQSRQAAKPSKVRASAALFFPGEGRLAGFRPASRHPHGAGREGSPLCRCPWKLPPHSI